MKKICILLLFISSGAHAMMPTSIHNVGGGWGGGFPGHPGGGNGGMNGGYPDAQAAHDREQAERRADEARRSREAANAARVAANAESERITNKAREIEVARSALAASIGPISQADCLRRAENYRTMMNKRDFCEETYEILKRHVPLTREEIDCVLNGTSCLCASPQLDIREKYAPLAVTAQNTIRVRNSETASQLNSLGDRVSPELNTYVNNQLQISDQMISSLVVDSQRGHMSSGAFDLIKDYSTNLSVATRDYVRGLGNGLYDGFASVTDASIAIYNHPQMLASIPTKIMNFIDSPFGGASYRSIYNKVNEAYSQYKFAITHASAEDVGYFQGKLVSDVLFAAATVEVLPLSKSSLFSIEKQLLKSGASETIGRAVVEAPQSVEKLSNVFILQDAAKLDAALAAHPEIQVLRAEYNTRVVALSEVGERLGATALTEEGKETVARHVSGLRREIGREIKDRTPVELRLDIYERNLVDYNDEFGPTIEFLRAKGKSWDQIIQSAARPNGNLNKRLGVLNGQH